MYLDVDDKRIVVEYLVKNKKMLRSLPDVKLLGTQKRKALKENDQAFHDDIEAEYLSSVKYIIAQDVGRNTGLSVDGIIYIIDCMGTTNFRDYLKGKLRVIK